MIDFSGETEPSRAEDIVDEEHFWREDDFDKRHDLIMKRFRDVIEDVDRRDLEVVTVVPALAELSNDNFWRLLRSLAMQRGVDPSRFVVLYGVNNSKSDSEANAESFRENRAHLSLMEKLRQVGSGKLGVDDAIDEYLEEFGQEFPLSEHEKKVFKLAVDRGVQIRGVNMVGADFGERGDKGDNPTGVVRDTLGHLAGELLQEKQNEGWIDFIDGDCSLSPDYYAGLAGQGQQAEVAVKRLFTVSPEPPRLTSGDPEVRVTLLLEYYNLLFSQRRWWYLRDVTPSSEDSWQSKWDVNGPSVAVRPSVFQRVGGYPRTGLMNTDFKFGGALGELGVKQFHSVEGEVLLSNRGRESSVDGGRELGGNDVWEIWERTEGERRNWSNLGVKYLLKKDEEMRKKYGQVYIDIRDREFRNEQLRRRWTIDGVEEIVGVIVGADNLVDRTNEQLISLLEDKLKVRVRLLDYLQSNPMLVGLVRDIVAMENLSGLEPEQQKEKIMEFLAENLPDWFGEPKVTVPYLDSDLRLRGEGDVGQKGRGDYSLRDYAHIDLAVQKVQAREANRQTRVSTSSHQKNEVA